MHFVRICCRLKNAALRCCLYRLNLKLALVSLFLFALSNVDLLIPEEVECEPGEYLDPDLKVCYNCQQGTFSAKRNQAAYCADCSKGCFDQRNAVELHRCNSTHDTICQCKDGYYALSDRIQCRKHIRCPENCLKYPGSVSSKAVCYDPCPTTTSPQELSVESSTAVVTNYKSIGSLANPNSSLLDMTTSSSNHSASDNFQILLPVLITVFVLTIVLAIVLIIYHWKKICRCLKSKRFCGQHIYQAVNGVDQHVRVNHPPPPPRRNASLAGNDHDSIRQQLDGSDYRPASLSFENEVLSHGTLEAPLQELEPLHEEAVWSVSQQNAALAQVPSQILPLVPQTAGEASSEETEALLHDSQRQGSSSRPSLHPGVLLPEGAYAHAHMLSGPTDVQNSPTGHDLEDRNDTSNSEDLGGSQTRPGSEDLQDSPPVPGVQDNRRTSTRPCARVPPFVMMPQRELNLEANDPQHPQVNQPQHLPVNHPGHNQPNNPPDVPNPVVNVESVYSMESMSQENELT